MSAFVGKVLHNGACNYSDQILHPPINSADLETAQIAGVQKGSSGSQLDSLTIGSLKMYAKGIQRY